VGHTKFCDGAAVMGHIVWATLIFPTSQLVWVARILVCGRHLLSESPGAFPELQDSMKNRQYFSGEPVPPMGSTPDEEEDDDEDDDNE
jgi:hypothetical protein